MILLVDNFDSFTYNLVDYFNQLGMEIDVVRNNIDPESIDWKKYNGLVLSPGPESPEKANYLLSYLKKGSELMPVLGICLGHQAINQYFGGTLKKGEVPMHGKVSTITQTVKDSIFNDITLSFNVVRYHSLVIDKLANDLEVIAESIDHEVMAIKHKRLKIYGVQFHPESILTDFGLKLLDNWIKVTGIPV